MFDRNPDDDWKRHLLHTLNGRRLKQKPRGAQRSGSSSLKERKFRVDEMRGATLAFGLRLWPNYSASFVILIFPARNLFSPRWASEFLIKFCVFNFHDCGRVRSAAGRYSAARAFGKTPSRPTDLVLSKCQLLSAVSLRFLVGADEFRRFLSSYPRRFYSYSSFKFSSRNIFGLSNE